MFVEDAGTGLRTFELDGFSRSVFWSCVVL